MWSMMRRSGVAWLRNPRARPLHLLLRKTAALGCGHVKQKLRDPSVCGRHVSTGVGRRVVPACPQWRRRSGSGFRSALSRAGCSLSPA